MAKKKSEPRIVTEFEKVIVTEGNYKQVDKNGKPYIRHVSKEDLEQAALTAKEMTEAGHKIPGPWKHDFEITAFNKVEEGNGGLLEDSTRNAGFWKRIWTRVNDSGKTELVGAVEAPGDKNDPDTPAGKIGTQVQDTSIYLRDKFVDGTGKEWKKALMHVALVTHPIEPGQQNFQEGDTYVAMSELVADEPNLTELVTKCKTILQLYLPPNTTMDNLVYNLLTSIGQYELMMQEEEKDDQHSSVNTSFKAEPVIMANLSKEAIEAVVKAGAINPDTKKPYTAEDFKTEPPKTDPVVMNQSDSLVMSFMEGQNKISLRGRIDRLVETRRVTKEFADGKLYPQVDNYKLTVANGAVVMSNLEAMVENFESLEAPKPVKTTESEGVVVMDVLFGDETDAKELDSIADEMVKYVG
jgi:hypothetical protein